MVGTRRLAAGGGGGGAVLIVSLILVSALAGLAGTAGARASVARDAGTPGPGNDPRFGVVQAFEAPQQAAAIGVRWQRIMFPWRAIQPNGPGDWKPGAAISDATLSAEIAAGRTPVGILLATPGWAARDPQYHDTSVPAGLDQPWNSPANHWGAFVHRIVAQYRGRVDSWIIWNEPDRYNGAQNLYYNWHGSIQDYYLLMKTAYLAAHDANPGCTVVMSGLTYWWDKEQGREQWLQSYLDLAAQDPTAAAHNDYFDVANTHLYANPLNAYAQPMVFRRILQAHGGDKPVWISESNEITTGDPGVPTGGAFRATLDQQANFVIEDLALALASGAPRVEIYKMRDGASEGNGELYGLVRNDGSTRPAYRAYAVAATYIPGATSALYTWHADESPPSPAEIDALLASDAQRYQFVWPAAVNMVILQRPGQHVTVVWDASPQPATAVIPAHGTNAILVDKSGVITPTAPAADGAYHLALEPSTNNSDPRDRTLYLVGGSPLILVEQALDATSTPSAPPTATAAVIPTAPPVATPTATAPPVATPVPTAPPAPFLAAQPVGPPPASTHARYFAATRHTLDGPFLAFYNAHGGAAVVGRPLTEPWSVGKATYQFFERLELRCTGRCLGPTAKGRVTVEPLGLWFTRSQRFRPSSRMRGHDTSYRYFPATRQALSGSFARFWAAHGGAAVLGLPISPQLYERVSGTRLFLRVQYLRNARLELWPSRPHHDTVGVGLLGEMYVRVIVVSHR